jgi:membrane-bound lytic murein transglycosylase D
MHLNLKSMKYFMSLFCVCIILFLFNSSAAALGVKSIKNLQDTSLKKINWDDLNPRAVGFVMDYLSIHQARLEKMKTWGNPYFLLIENILRKYNLPISLKYLAVIESNLNSNALSVAGAVGPWQLMPGTARELGLTVNAQQDERVDLYKSTHAAAKFLMQLHKDLGDWLLVIAAYNGGPARMQNIIRKTNSNNFWTIQNYLPAESRNHVKKFIATHYIFEKDGSETTGKKNTSAGATVLTADELNFTDTLVISGKYSSLVLSKTLGIDYAQFSRWNPAFDNSVIKGSYSMRLPKDKLIEFNVKKNQILLESVMLIMQQNINYNNSFPEPTKLPERSKNKL